MRESIVLIGAGSASFTRGLVADIISLGEELDLGLVDISADALAVAEGLSRKMIEAARAPIRLRAATDRRELLPGATAVICTVGVGGRRAWEQDVFIPRKHGIYQPVGDSVMPGGTSRALRMIPAMVAVAEDVLDLAPDALFFNYGNPMAPVCRAIRKATGAPVVGLCHGVNHVGQYLAGALGVAPEQFRYTAVGMNHLTWFTEVRVAGRDAMPALLGVAEQMLAMMPAGSVFGQPEGFAGAAPANRAGADGQPDLDRIQPFSWELCRLFGAFPAVLDRHVTEFFPGLFPGGRYYGKTLGVDAFSFEACIAGGDACFARMREDALSPEPVDDRYLRRGGGEHEQVIDIIRSIRADAGRIYSANLPNRGQVANLPADAVIECPCVADGTGLRPIGQPPLPAGIAGTLATRLAWVETVVEAALEGSRDKFIQALLLDGAVTSVAQAAALADDLLAAQKEYLPQFGGC